MSSCTCVFGPQRADKALGFDFGYRKSILQKLSMSTAAELWFDVAALVDGAVIVGTASLVHMLVNVHQTPAGTMGTNDCPQWQQWFLLVLLVPLVASLILFSVRAHLGASAGGYAYQPVPGTHYILRHQRYVMVEFVAGILSICAGAVMQVVAKPESWGVAAYKSGCTMFESPPSLLLWMVGELASIGYGIRFALIIWSYLARSSVPAALLAVLLLLGAGAAIAVMAQVSVTPWLVTVMNDYQTLVGTESAVVFELLSE